jgi:hypothetical protein
MCTGAVIDVFLDVVRVNLAERQNNERLDCRWDCVSVYTMLLKSAAAPKIFFDLSTTGKYPEL